MAVTKRGRRGAAASDAATIVSTRPEAPDFLTEHQAAEWKAVVDRMPADWFTRETHSILVQFVRHVESAHKIALAIDLVGTELIGTALGLDKFERLTRLHEREGRAISSLATRMRITQQSKYTAKAAGTGSKNAAKAGKPWQQESAS